MWQTALNTIGTAALAALAAVLVAGIKAFGDAGVEFINRKKDAIIAKIGADTYNHNLNVGRSIWGMVDEEVRTNPDLQKLANDVTARIQAKQTLFAQKIRKAIPGITDDEIEQLRQAVAGEVNKGREALITPAAEQAAEAPTAAEDKVAAPVDSAAQAGAQGGSGAVVPNAVGAA